MSEIFTIFIFIICIILAAMHLHLSSQIALLKFNVESINRTVIKQQHEIDHIWINNLEANNGTDDS